MMESREALTLRLISWERAGLVALDAGHLLGDAERQRGSGDARAQRHAKARRKSHRVDRT